MVEALLFKAVLSLVDTSTVKLTVDIGSQPPVDQGNQR
jgi:hypothetical protein